MPHPNKEYTVEVKHHPIVLDNMRHWQAFGSDKQIENFLQSKEEYEDNSIDSECEEEDQIIEFPDSKVGNQIIEYVSIDKQLDDSDVNISVSKDVHKLELHKINPEKEEFEVIQLKDNVLPTVLVLLEELFYFNDVAKKPKMEPIGANIEECNIGSEQNPKMIKLSKSLPIITKNDV